MLVGNSLAFEVTTVLSFHLFEKKIFSGDAPVYRHFFGREDGLLRIGFNDECFHFLLFNASQLSVHVPTVNALVSLCVSCSFAR